MNIFTTTEFHICCSVVDECIIILSALKSSAFKKLFYLLNIVYHTMPILQGKTLIRGVTAKYTYHKYCISIIEIYNIDNYFV